MNHVWLGMFLILAAPAQEPSDDKPDQEWLKREMLGQQIETAPVVDGDLSDPVWSTVSPVSGLVQVFPDPGKPATYDTQIRTAYDQEALFVAAHCQDPQPDQIIARVSRRDREVESDWFYVEIDSRHDKKTGFIFGVNAAGVMVDGMLFDENQASADWDGVWQAEVRIVPDGWDVEMRIPLHLLRFSSGEQVRFGINFTRRISRLNETNKWQYISPESGLRVSRFGVLQDLHIPKVPKHLEMTPYIATRPSFKTGDPGDVSSPRPLDLGVDAKLGLGSNFMLTMSANPDFGQVEVDQLVLNLTTIETYYPEKRPFFSEDSSLFQMPRFGDGPRADLFYSRRIGRAPRSPNVADGEELLRPPSLPRIYGAAKLAGRTDGRFSLGLLQAMTSEETGRIRDGLGNEVSRIAEPLTSFSVLRLKQEFSQNSAVGLLATAVATPQHGTAVTGGTDLQLQLFDGSYQMNFLTYLSGLTQERYRWHDDFTRAALEKDGPLGYGGEFVFLRKSGEYWIGAVGGSYRSPNLALNDMGYVDRGDQVFGYGWIQYHYLKPLGPIASIRINANAWLIKNTSLLNIGDGLNVNGDISFKNAWSSGFYFEFDPRACDDRETRSAGRVAYCWARPRMTGGIYAYSDAREVVSAGVEAYLANSEHGLALQTRLPITINPMSRLQIELAPSYKRTSGSIRWIDTQSLAQGDRYLFAEQHYEYLDLTLRGTFTFTTTLTLQVYTQIFLASVDNGRKMSVLMTDGNKRIDVGDLTDASDVSDDYDFTSGNLNLSTVLRWEYLPGSVAYLVYTGAFGQQLDFPDFRYNRLFWDVLQQGAAHVVMLKLSYFWG